MYYHLILPYLSYLLRFNRGDYDGRIDRTYSPPNDDGRREREWNQYVAQGSPPRGMHMDVSCLPIGF